MREKLHLIDIVPDKQIAVNSVIALINGDKNKNLEDYNKIENKSNVQNNESTVENKQNNKKNQIKF